MNAPRKGTLGSILLSCGMITEDDVQNALAEQKRSGLRFGEALVSLGIVTQEDIEWALSSQLEIPFVRLRKEDVDPEALRLVPCALAWRHDLVPLIRIGDELKVAMADPLDREAIERVEETSGCTVTVAVATPDEIHRTLEELYGPRGMTVSLGFSSALLPPPVTSRIDADPTGGECIRQLLLHAAGEGLSRLSLFPTAEGVTVIGRKGGDPVELGRIGHQNFHHLIAGLRIEARLTNCGDGSAEGEITVAAGGKHLGFSVSTLETIHGTMVTFRGAAPQLPPALHPPLTPGEDELVRRLTGQPGIVALCDQSGRELPTLFAILARLPHLRNRQTVVIGNASCWGAGSPLTTVVPPSGNDPERAIMSLLPHAPGIIVVEDASDPRAFRGGVRCALAGALVLLGYPGVGRGEARRLLAWMKERHLPGPLYNGGIQIRRIRTLCRSCRHPRALTADEAAAIHPSLPPGEYQAAAGCPTCRHEGYGGERLLITPLEEGDGGATEGVGLDLLLQGTLSPEEFAKLLDGDATR